MPVQEVVIPTVFPVDFFSIAVIGIGVTFGRAFGKNVDQDIQRSEWFKRRSGFSQQVIRRLCDFLHHWWAGVLIMLYVARVTEGNIPNVLQIPGWAMEYAYWFGLGLFIDDIRDYKNILKRLKSAIGDQAGDGG